MWEIEFFGWRKIMHHNKAAYPKQLKKFVNEFTAHKLLELFDFMNMQRRTLPHPCPKKNKIHEPSSYKSHHIMPAYKGGKENTCYSRHKPSTQHKKAAKPSPNSQHTSNKCFFSKIHNYKKQN